MGCGDRSDQPDDQRNNKVDTTPVTPDEANTLALVDGIPISIAERTLYLQQRQQQSQTTDLNEITEELINLKVIVLNAEKRACINARMSRQNYNASVMQCSRMYTLKKKCRALKSATKR